MWQDLPPNTRDWSEEDWERFFEEQDRLFQETHAQTLQQSSEGAGAAPSCPIEAVGPDDETDEAWLDDDDEEPEDPLDAQVLDELDEIPAWRAGVELSDRVYTYVAPVCREQPGGPVLYIARTLCRESYLVHDYVEAGHEIGYDEETLCGNIAMCLRARRAIDRCIQCLERLGGSGSGLGGAGAEQCRRLTTRAIVTRVFIDQRIAELRQKVWWR